MNQYQYPEYTPSSLGRELGIMFAFLGACVVTMGVYSVIWRRKYYFENPITLLFISSKASNLFLWLLSNNFVSYLYFALYITGCHEHRVSV